MMFEIEISKVPPSLNRFAGRENAWEYRKAKEEWTSMVYLLSRPKRPPEPYNKATVFIIYRFKDRRRRDPDNYAGKLILDGLTKAGIIADDSFAHIRLMLLAEDETGKPRTRVIVRERSDSDVIG